MTAPKPLKSPLRFAKWVLVAIVAVIVLSALWTPVPIESGPVDGATAKGAMAAIALLKDWAVWMAGIQTATLASLGLLVRDGMLAGSLTAWQARWALLTALFNAAALLFSAWLLTSLSSLMLRACSSDQPTYDFYQWPIYAFLEGSWFKNFSLHRILRVEFFAFWNHWLWALGILSFGALCVSLVAQRSKTAPVEAGPDRTGQGSPKAMIRRQRRGA